MDQIGPKRTDHIIQSYLSCFGCVHYKKSLVVSGRNPVYDHTCMALPEPMNFDGNLPNEDHTPKFCPILVKRNG